MIELVKQKIANYIVGSELKKKKKDKQLFTNIFSSSLSFLVVMPEDEKDFHNSFDVLNFLESNGKNLLIFTSDFRVSLLPLRFRQKVFTIGVTDRTKLNLPSGNVRGKLASMNFDVVLDLNRATNLFSSFIANLAASPVRIGFSKSEADRFYNLQISNNSEDAKLSYMNFINCLKMF